VSTSETTSLQRALPGIPARDLAKPLPGFSDSAGFIFSRSPAGFAWGLNGPTGALTAGCSGADQTCIFMSRVINDQQVYRLLRIAK
jgi:hypothetical protein